MEGAPWLGQHWLELLNAIGVVGGLVFTASSLRSETVTRRVGNLLTITRNHRELWTELYRRPELARVLDVSADLSKQPVTPEEEIFVNLVVLQISSVFEALKSGLVIKQEGLRRDVWWFISLPIPKAVWEKGKVLQNDDFVAYVEACRDWK